MTEYAIKDWAKHYENHDTRKLRRLTWVLVPNRHDGKGYRRVMKMPDGIAILGAWLLILQVASGEDREIRGRLRDDDGPLRAIDIADKTGAPVEVIERALTVLSSKEIGWIEADESPEDSRDLPEHREEPGDCRARMEGNGREWKGTESEKSAKVPVAACGNVENSPPPAPPLDPEPDTHAEILRPEQILPNPKNPPADVGKPSTRKPHLQPIRDALTEAVGSPPDEPIVEQLAYAGALHGAHPAVVARWIFRKSRARSAIRSHGFFAAALPADLPGWLAGTPRYADGAFSVQSRIACRCGRGEDVQFADCVVGHACPVSAKRGMARVGTETARYSLENGSAIRRVPSETKTAENVPEGQKSESPPVTPRSGLRKAELAVRGG